MARGGIVAIVGMAIAGVGWWTFANTMIGSGLIGFGLAFIGLGAVNAMFREGRARGSL